MKVFILTEGGKNAGFGHITRCTSIYQAFEEREVEPELIINGDETVHDFVKDKNYKVFDWLNDRRTLFAALREANIVFIDSYLAEYYLYEKISSIVETAVYFDDVVRIEYPKGFVINGAVFAEQLSYPPRQDITYLLGTQYTPVRKEFWDVPAKPIRDVLETVMITFGGADVCNLTPKVLKLLVDAYPQLNKKAVIGKSFPNRPEIEALKDHNTELVYYPDAAEMKKFMLESDIAISAGGQTLCELARVGVPTIVVAVADNQVDNIKSLQEADCVSYAGWWEDRNVLDNISACVEEMRHKVLRSKRSLLGRKFVDGGGSRRIVDFLLSSISGKANLSRRCGWGFGSTQ